MLDSITVKCRISDQRAKAAMVDVAMGEETTLKFTKKDPFVKTESRYQSEH